MTRDIIAVERETDGERCGKGCPHYHEENDNAPDFCSAFEAEDDERNGMDGMTCDGAGRTMRLRACLAQPPAVLLTPAMREAVEEAIELLLSTINDYGDCEHDVGHCVCKYHGAVFNLRAAFNDAALAAAKEDR